jgi:hypothetical protein
MEDFIVKTEPYARVMGVLRSVAGAWKSARQEQAALDELACCGRSEIERIAADLNLTSDELKNLASRGLESAGLLDQRLAALGIDPAKIDKTIMCDLQRTCSCCDKKVECSNDLPSRAAKWPSYCPNVRPSRR